MRDAVLMHEHIDAISEFIELYEVRYLQACCRHIASLARDSFARRSPAVRFYVCGGDEDESFCPFACFSPGVASAGQWQTLPPLPGSRQLVELAGSIYAGVHEHDDGWQVLRYNPSEGSWKPLPPMIMPRVAYKMVVASRRLFVIGGCAAAFDELSDDQIPVTSEVYDPDANWWHPLPLNAVQLCSPLVAEDSDSIYFCAMVSDEDQDTRAGTFRRFDAQLARWHGLPAPPMFNPTPERSEECLGLHFAFMLASSGSVYLASDFSIDRFDIRTSAWETLPGMPTEISHVDSAELAYGGRLFVCGGHDDAGAVVDSFGCYCPKAGSWMLLPRLPMGCSHPAMVGLAGHVYVLGGYAANETTSHANMRFSLQRQVWEVLPSMPHAMSNPEVTVSWSHQTKPLKDPTMQHLVQKYGDRVARAAQAGQS